MGQVVGKPSLAIVPKFAKWPKKALENVWASYNLLGESWGLNLEDWTMVLQGSDYVSDSMDLTSSDIKELFEMFDTDNNGLVDALEMIVGLGLVSGLDLVEKIIFVFSVYDFDSRLSLSFDELSLLLRSSAKACAKMYPSATLFQLIDDKDIETYADLIFEVNRLNRFDQRISVAAFREYATSSPVTSSWLDFVSASESAPHIGLSKEALSVGGGNVIAVKNGANAFNANDDALLPVLLATNSGSSKGEIDSLSSAPSPAASTTLDWFAAAEAMRPEESLTLVPRTDPSEDLLEPLWIHGINANTVAGHVAGYACDNSLIYSASRFLILMKRKVDEESGAVSWSQSFKLDHQTNISSIEFSVDRSLAVTTERGSDAVTAENGTSTVLLPPIDGRASHDSIYSGKQFVHVWKLGGAELQLLNSFAFPASTSIFTTSLSSDNSKIIVVTGESNIIGARQAFASIYDVNSRRLLSTVALRNKPEDITSVTFASTSTIFAVAARAGGNGSKTAVDFYVDETLSPLGSNGLTIYSLRDALFPLKSYPSETCVSNASAITRFDGADEFVTGTCDGYVLFWQFRSCIQAIKVHSGAVTKLAYCAATQTVVSSGADGKIVLLTLKKPVEVKNTRKTAVRTLELGGVIDVTRHNIAPETVAAIHANADGTRVIVPTTSGDIFELSLTGPEFKVEVKVVAATEGGADGEEKKEGGEDAAPPPAEDEGPPITKLGDDLNKGVPIITCHKSSNCGVTSIARTAGGFLSTGTDGTLKLWNASEGPQRVTKSIALNIVATKLSTGASYVAAANDKIIAVYSLPDLTFVTELSANITAPITDLKVTADGSVIVAMEDATIAIFALGTPTPDAPSADADPAAVVAAVDTTPCWMKKAGFSLPHVAARFDLSVDGAYIRSMGPNNELSITSIGGETIGAALTVPETLRTLSFASHNVLCAWDTKGVFNHLNGANALSKITTSDRSNALYLSGCDDGSIALTRLPAFEYAPDNSKPRAGLTRIALHNSAVSALSFIEEGAKLVTAGARDGLVIVWRVTYDTEEAEIDAPPAEGEEQKEEAEEEEEGGKPKQPPLVDSDDDEDLKDGDKATAHLASRKKGVADNSAANLWASSVNYSATCTPRNADVAAKKIRLMKESLVDYSPVIPKGAKRAIARKANEKARIAAINDTSFEDLPSPELRLAWVHGYSARTCKHGLRYNAKGSIIYPAGANVIIYDKIEHKQIIISAHNDSITALDLHAASGVGASAHTGAGMIRIALWNSTNGDVIKYLPVGLVNGVSALSFSNCGKYIAAASLDNDHSVSIFDLSSGALLSRIAGGSKKILNLTFSQASTGPSSFRILAGGVGHFALLDSKFGRFFSRKNGLYGAGNKKVDITSAASLPLSLEGGNEFVIGLSNGQIGVVARGDRRIGSYFPVQKGSVTCVAVIKVKDANADEPAPVYKIVTGGTDGFIKVLDMEGQPTSQANGQPCEFNPYKPIPALEGFVPAESSTYNLHPFGTVRGYRGFCIDKSNRKLLFGTSAGEIGEMEIETGIDTNLGKGPLVVAHFRGKLEALATHPIRQEMLTVGDDKILRIWSVDKKAMVNQIDLPDKATCATYSPNGHLIAVGLIKRDHEGAKATTGVAVVSFLQSKLQVVHVTDDCLGQVTSVLFTPDGKQLYVGCKDGKIYVYDALDNFKLTNRLEPYYMLHVDPVNQLDVSSDSTIIVSYSESGAIRFWDNTDRTYNQPLTESLKAKFLQNPSYFVRQGVSGMEALGTFKSDSVVGETSTLGFSKSAKLVVTGDVFGAVRLYCASAKNLEAPYKSFAGHSAGGVSKAAFTMQDLHVITIGRFDRLVCTWKVVFPNASANPSDDPTVAYSTRAAVNSINNVKLIEEDSSAANFASSFEKSGVVFTCDQASSSSSSSVATSLVGMVGVGVNAIMKPVSENVFLKHEVDSTVMKIMTEDEARALEVGEEAVAPDGEGAGAEGEEEQKESTAAVEQNNENKSKSFRYSSTYFASPVARYCGNNDIVTSSGKVASIIRRVNGLKSSVTLSSSYDTDIGVVTTSSCARFVAVGTTHSWDASVLQAGEFNGSVDIYHAVSYKPLTSLAGQFKGGVVHIAFSNDSTYMAVLADDVEHTAYLYRSAAGTWEDDVQFITKSAVSLSELSLVAFLSQADDASRVCIAVAGVGGLYLLHISGRNVIKMEPRDVFANRPLGITALASMPNSGEFITGNSIGEICSWSFWPYYHASGRYLTNSCSAGPISSIATYYYETTTTSSSDSKVVSKLRSEVPSSSSSITSTSVSAGIVVGAKEGLSIYSASGDLSYRVPIEELSRPTNHFVTGAAAGGAKLHDDSEVFVTSISPDARFKKVVIGLSSSQIVEFSLDSRACHQVSYGDSRDVRGLATHPTDPDIYATFTSDNSVNIWSVKHAALIGIFKAGSGSGKVTSIKFVSNDLLLVGCGDLHPGHGQSTSGSIIAVACNFRGIDPALAPTTCITTQVDFVGNVGRGGLTGFKVSADQSKVAVCSEDGNVYLFRANELSGTGMTPLLTIYGALTRYGSWSPASCDFSTCGNWLRAFGRCESGDRAVPLDIFDVSGVESADAGALAAALALREEEEYVGVAADQLTPIASPSYLTQVGKRLTDASEFEYVRANAQWLTSSSAASADLRGLYRQEMKAGASETEPALELSGFSVSTDKKLVAAAYSDGVVRVFILPVAEDAVPLSTIDSHIRGNVIPEFTSSSSTYGLLTYGRNDGIVASWNLSIN